MSRGIFWPSGLTLTACLGLVCLLLVLVTAVFGLIYTPYDPLQPDFLSMLEAPSARHPFGTDAFGRDVLSRILAGSATSLSIAVSAIFLALLLGGFLGALSGYFGGVTDALLSMLANTALALPGILLALAIMAVIGPSFTGLIFALGIAYSPAVFRVMRANVLSVREKEFIEASRALGNGEVWTIAVHVAPNCLSPLIVLGAALTASAILAEAALSFLGLGVPPPAPSWGGMLAENRAHITTAPWLVMIPGAAISFALLAINLTGDLLRDRLDPRMRNII